MKHDQGFGDRDSSVGRGGQGFDDASHQHRNPIPDSRFPIPLPLIGYAAR